MHGASLRILDPKQSFVGGRLNIAVVMCPCKRLAPGGLRGPEATAHRTCNSSTFFFLHHSTMRRVYRGHVVFAVRKQFVCSSQIAATLQRNTPARVKTRCKGNSEMLFSRTRALGNACICTPALSRVSPKWFSRTADCFQIQAT